MQPPGPPPPPGPPNGGYGAPPPGYPPPAPPPPYGNAPPGYYPAPPPAFAPNDPKASTALALGISSIFCFGLLTGVPAIILGVSSRKRIAQSNGALQGDGMALGGIITGACGSFLSVMTVGLFILGIAGGVMAAAFEPHATTTPPSVTAPSEESATEGDDDDTATEPAEPAEPKTPAPPATPITIIDLSPKGGPLKAQLQNEAKAAKGAKQTMLVQTTAPKCGACREIADAMRDNEVAAALDGVRVVRVDIEAFKADLKATGLSRDGLPWFFLLDSALTPHDAISADEWDANVAENIAPVLGEFVQGKLTERRSAAPTSL